MAPEKRKSKGSSSSSSARKKSRSLGIDDPHFRNSQPALLPTEQSSISAVSSSNVFRIGNQETTTTATPQGTQTDAAPSGYAQHAPSTIESVLFDLSKLKFTLYQDVKEVVDVVGREIFKGMKPGRCLLGNGAEEAELYRPKNKPHHSIFFLS
jgi:hypothetical protein